MVYAMWLMYSGARGLVRPVEWENKPWNKRIRPGMERQVTSCRFLFCCPAVFGVRIRWEPWGGGGGEERLLVVCVCVGAGGGVISRRAGPKKHSRM